MFLLYLSLRTFRERLGEGEAAITSGASYRGLAGTCVSSFFLTNTNPSTILSLAAIFAGLGLIGKDVGYIPATSLVLGVFWGQPCGGCS
jgi:putative LysE/RhtB family amino acid efflux pump